MNLSYSKLFLLFAVCAAFANLCSARESLWGLKLTQVSCECVTPIYLYWLYTGMQLTRQSTRPQLYSLGIKLGLVLGLVLWQGLELGLRSGLMDSVTVRFDLVTSNWKPVISVALF